MPDLHISPHQLEANNRFFYDSKVQRAGCNLLVNLCRDESTRTIVGNTDAMSHLFVIFYTEMGWPPDELRRQADELIRQRVKAETVRSACILAETPTQARARVQAQVLTFHQPLSITISPSADPWHLPTLWLPSGLRRDEYTHCAP